MFRFDPLRSAAKHRAILCDQHIICCRYLSTLTNPQYQQFSCHKYNVPRSSRIDSQYLRFQKRSIGMPSLATSNLILKGMSIYFLIYLSYKFFIKREERGPRLEIVDNHCYSPFHINTILSLIYPKLLPMFQR